ncbi:hypothetical protein CSUB_C0301 [Candidatus Caldarchaeum subterraneum]|uniref:Uncharacterized protein n=1 Tax=Caldiarchaeum subterraneum TaxID=311458 RepID=E6N4V1_CALS0|nr:hypothetical protein HGMM_F36E03C02 [Candidatus Caldarchaeum subterraneum]BAJ50162.1 hypothetical protein CSUB_C0301 [Candidatus Caldarchaeum subterraneum]
MLSVVGTFVLVGDKEVLKIEISRHIAEKFRRWVAERYGMKRGALSRAVEDLIAKTIGENGHGGVEAIVCVGLLSGYIWRGEDLCEALPAKHVSIL